MSALAWRQCVEGLSGGGDAHAGWLFSAARRVLNLWECEPGGGVGGEAALSLMHSQATSIRATSMDVDADSGTLLAAAADARGGADAAAVCLHTLRPTDFMFMLGALKMPKPLGGGKAHTQGAPLIAVSLSPCGGPLAGCVALAFGKDVSVAALPRASGLGVSAPAAAAAQKAHYRAMPQGCSVHVSALAPWPQAPLIITLGSDSSLSVWDMRIRPTGAAVSPAASVTKAGAGAVVSVAAVATTMVLSLTAKGHAALWDLRKASGPTQEGLMSMSLAASSQLTMPASARAFAGCVAPETGDALGVMCVGEDGQGSSLHCALVSPVVGGGLGAWCSLALPATSAAPAREAGHAAGSPLCFGRCGGTLYAGGADGVINVYRS